MGDNVSTLPLRGQTLLTGDNRTLSSTGQNPEGKKKEFADIGPSSYGTNAQRSNDVVVCQLVRNVSTIVLLAKRVVKWKTGYEGKQVDGYCEADHEQVAGVVDEHLPSSGLPINDLGWIAIKGHSLVNTAPNASTIANTFSVGDICSALTAAASTSATAGRLQPYAATSAVTTVTTVMLNRIGRALSAKTSAQTNTDLLMDLNILV